MVIDFSKNEAAANKNFKGGDGEVLIKGFNDSKVKIMQLTIPQGSTIGQRTHTTNSEELLVLQGYGHFIIDGKREDVKAGMSHYCPVGSTHSFLNDGNEPVIFFAVVPEQ